MKLYMTRAIFSLRGRFTIQDAAGNDRYHVEGKVLSIGRHLGVYCAQTGKRVAYIRQVLPTLMPRFAIEIDGEHICYVAQKFQFLRNDYTIYGLPLELSGDFTAHEYEMLYKGQPVMRMSRKWFTFGDSYELHIAKEKKELVCVCIALAVGNAFAMRRR